MRAAFLFVLVATVCAKYDHVGKFKVIKNECVQTDYLEVTDFDKGKTVEFKEVADVKAYPWTLKDLPLFPVYSSNSETTDMPKERVYVLTQTEYSVEEEQEKIPTGYLYLINPQCGSLLPDEKCKPETSCKIDEEDPENKYCREYKCKDYDQTNCASKGCKWMSAENSETEEAECVDFEKCENIVITNIEEDCPKNRCEVYKKSSSEVGKCVTPTELCSSYEDAYTCLTYEGCEDSVCTLNLQNSSINSKTCKWTGKCSYSGRSGHTRRQYSTNSNKNTQNLTQIQKRDLNVNESFMCEWNKHIVGEGNEPNQDGKYLTCTRYSTATSTKKACKFVMEFTDSAQTVFASFALIFSVLLFVLY